VFDLL